jgi:hypothetical protein
MIKTVMNSESGSMVKATSQAHNSKEKRKMKLYGAIDLHSTNNVTVVIDLSEKMPLGEALSMIIKSFVDRSHELFSSGEVSDHRS